MKVAILLVGHIRTWELCRENFIQRLQQSSGDQIDIFVHTYTQLTHKNNPYEKNPKDLTQEEIMDKLSGLNVVQLIIEDCDTVTNDFIEKYPKYRNFSGANQGRALQMCNEMRKQYEIENNIQYDVIVRTRFDLILYSKPNFSKCLSNDTIYICHGGSGGSPDDMFAFGNRKVMDEYCDRHKYTLNEMIINGDNFILFDSHHTLKIVGNSYPLQSDIGVVCKRTWD